MNEVKQKWLKPSEIAQKGLIRDSKGTAGYSSAYRHILRLINSGRLKSKVWAHQGDKPYFVVHVDEIHKYNSEWTDV
jgi:hypothetical protein